MHVSSEIVRLRTVLESTVLGQAEALAPISDAYCRWRAGLAGLDRPVGAFLLLGPTGVGKTLTVERLAEILHGDRRKLLKVHCAEYKHSHEIARLIGAPPGYIGHKETQPRFSQRRMQEAQSRNCQLVLILFDEIEKAHPDLWDLLLGVLDKGELFLGDGSNVDLRQSMIFLTSNVGAGEAAGAVGFTPRPRQVAESAARRLFSPEFRNRLTATLTYRDLKDGDLRAIAELELQYCAARLLDRRGLLLELDGEIISRVTEAARYERDLGARPIRRAIERLLELPLAHMLLDGQFQAGDEITVCQSEGENALAFHLHSTEGVLL